ncbi:hypothetical protein HMPREF1008_00898 [Olsenella sp. oral taxon 809 str. F0356]|uniref:hypothetical protein n=1 Tax=Olsenella sp. oral taxon 809 TaxID=661086 RepID=UPI000231ED9C|nr:hypothetical protein [Olsenella sp. oral taxon 809]EHF02192.1 hypothetical protein HMPREF1008_00898 [Olsenella sp. oral taxon 809 str. F0356]
MARLKLTQELIDKAAELKRGGLSNKDICHALGITEMTWYRWLDKPTTKLHRAFCESIKKAEADYKAELLESILATATREKNPQWTAAAWLLERKYSDEYAQTTRQKDERQEDAPQIVLGVTVQAVKTGDEGADD